MKATIASFRKHASAAVFWQPYQHPNRILRTTATVAERQTCLTMDSDAEVPVSIPGPGEILNGHHLFSVSLDVISGCLSVCPVPAIQGVPYRNLNN